MSCQFSGGYINWLLQFLGYQLFYTSIVVSWCPAIKKIQVLWEILFAPAKGRSISLNVPEVDWQRHRRRFHQQLQQTTFGFYFSDILGDVFPWWAQFRRKSPRGIQKTPPPVGKKPTAGNPKTWRFASTTVDSRKGPARMHRKMVVLLQGCRFGPESSRQSLVETQYLDV